MPISPISKAQKAAYHRDGYLLVSGLIPQDIAQQADAFVWQDLGVSQDHPDSWPQKGGSSSYNNAQILACYTPQFLDAAAALCDADPSTIHPPGGALAINTFPQQSPWDWPGPHIDHAIKDHGHKTFPLPFRIATMTFLHDIAPHGGGTVVWPNSHRAIAALAHSRPAHYEYMWVLNQELDQAELDPPVELVPAAGDVLFYQCLCAHAGSAKDLLEKIKLVWASLYSAHAIGYRRRNGISQQNAHMAVVVQTQLCPDAAGVLFTRDPISAKNQIVISAALGLGEGVVAGTAGADRFVLGLKAGSVLSADIAAKKIRIANRAKGGIQAVAVEATKQEKPALTKSQLAKLAGIGQKLVKLFGGPQDIEFAIVGNRVHILQSRPMTAIKSKAKPDQPWQKGLDRKFTWYKRGGPYARLEQDTALERLKHMKDCYDEVGSSMTVNHIGHLSNGYLYVRSNEVGERTLKKRHKLQAQRVDASLKKGKSYFEDALQAIIEARLDKLRQMLASSKTFAAQVDYMQACIETMGYVQGNLHWRQGKPEGRPSWRKEFTQITGQSEKAANVYLQAIQNRMTRLISRIRELAKIAQSDPVLKRIFIDRDFDALTSSKVLQRQKAQRFHRRFKAMMRVYGIRAGHGYGTGSSFATPTWNMDHRIPFEFIATYVEQDLAKLDRLEKQARAQRLKATRRMRRQLASDPAKLKQFNQALAEAQIGVRFLEDHNYYMEQCTIGTMRQGIHLVGQALVERGQLDAPDDVFHFSIAELKQLGKKKTQNDLRPLVLERVAELERRGRMNPPATLGKKPPKSKNSDQAPPAGLDGNLIRGASASSGLATGRAVVAHPGRERPRLHPGDILVAENVGPDWTPLFALIGGLVLDSGSLSQHAALVAREYRIPAVMQTKDASKIIQDGQQIAIDGDGGIVKLSPGID